MKLKLLSLIMIFALAFMSCETESIEVVEEQEVKLDIQIEPENDMLKGIPIDKKDINISVSRGMENVFCRGDGRPYKIIKEPDGVTFTLYIYDLDGNVTYTTTFNQFYATMFCIQNNGIYPAD